MSICLISISLNITSFLFRPSRFVNETQLEVTDRISVDLREARGELLATLYIDECVVEDAGKVKVIAKNVAGEATCEADFTVSSKPDLSLLFP